MLFTSYLVLTLPASLRVFYAMVQPHIELCVLHPGLKQCPDSSPSYSPSSLNTLKSTPVCHKQLVLPLEIHSYMAVVTWLTVKAAYRIVGYSKKDFVFFSSL